MTNSIEERLVWPKEPVDVVMDTDTFNEIDDQFALAYLIKSSNRCHLKAIYAAPFYNRKSTSPKDGMNKSYDEIMHLLRLMHRSDLESIVYHGSDRYLKTDQEPVESAAAKNLVELAKHYSLDHPLYVIATAAITDIASAILMDASIVNRIVVVWLGGHAHSWQNTAEFNMVQDFIGSRVLFNSGVALVQLPCLGVVDHFAISRAELEDRLNGQNELCDYLVRLTVADQNANGQQQAWSRIIWDVTAVAWLIDESFTNSRLVPTPYIESDPRYDIFHDGHYQYAFNQSRPLMRYVYQIDRDPILEDLVNKLTQA